MKRVLLIGTLLFAIASITYAAGDWWGVLDAKRMYEKMAEAVVIQGQDSCEEGVTTKFAGDLQCAMYGNGESYVCDLGIDLIKGKSVVGRGC
jgi:hypothetical protein